MSAADSFAAALAASDFDEYRRLLAEAQAAELVARAQTLTGQDAARGATWPTCCGLACWLGPRGFACWICKKIVRRVVTARVEPVAMPDGQLDLPL